jgi:hypothetical protein
VPICERATMLKRVFTRTSSTTLAPFYARAWRRRVWQRLRWPLLASGVVFLLVVAMLIASGYLI